MQLPRPFHDVKELKLQNHRLDWLVDTIVESNKFALQKHRVPSCLFAGYYAVTVDLVLEFKPYAVAFMKRVQADKPEYGYLYNIIDERHPSNHAVYLTWEDFPLLKGQVLHELRQVARLVDTTDTEHYDATMLYLLLFYALLINSGHSNWVTLEYLTNCNKDHQYAIHVNWKLPEREG